MLKPATDCYWKEAGEGNRTRRGGRSESLGGSEGGEEEDIRRAASRRRAEQSVIFEILLGFQNERVPGKTNESILERSVLKKPYIAHIRR